MSNSSKRAVALVKELRRQAGLPVADAQSITSSVAFPALCRQIEYHDECRRGFSNVIEKLCETVLAGKGHQTLRERLTETYVIPKADPVSEALKEVDETGPRPGGYEANAEALRAALASRGLEIRKAPD